MRTIFTTTKETGDSLNFQSFCRSWSQHVIRVHPCLKVFEGVRINRKISF